ncbi:MAG: double-strand break repair protein AddB [Devosia nanyangense]|uniref:Double-strand break repair protein AddB n=1 Tax=Devosia nanyangense TaxID=1228055 RepID=A0A933KX34_9HYPH|nr:double-strand break repair protein AddB [Devosia nanyangense]
MSRRGLYTIAPHAPFLVTLVERMLDGTLLGDWERAGPFWLADVTIILPTRRARLTLAELFAERLGGAALLPDIRTFGGESADEEPFLPPVDAPAPMPPASLIERRLTLSRLVEAFAKSAEGFASPPNAAEIFWLADSLGTLIDDFSIEDVATGKLDALVPADLAANWEQILTFLRIALTAWPEILAGRGKVDGAVARNERLRRQAATAEVVYGGRPVIAAGSTGSIPATAALLKAIAALPRGALVLPGLDTTLSAKQHEMLIEGETTQGHPQYSLGRLLRGLGAGIADVEELAGEAARTTLVRTALAPADETTLWAGRRDAIDLAAALDGVGILAAPNADLEARAIALAARAAIAARKSVGIIARDQTLARRIVVELGRHGIAVDDPAGTPLYQSAVGRLARQVLAIVGNDFAAVDTVALLRNRAVTLGLERAEISRHANRLDLKLRGQRPMAGLAGLLAFAAGDELEPMLRRLGEATQPVADLGGRAQIDAGTLAAALHAAIAALSGGDDLPGLAEFEQWADEMAGLVDRGAGFPPVNLDGVLAALMAGAKVQAAERRRDDIHIWGELEARLQTPDLMILAGLNEGIWPPIADPGPWLSRGMRIKVGLEPPERQQGQAAHDFQMAMGNAEVLLAYATRMGTSPALPSRLVQRLDALIGETEARTLRARGDVWLEQARAIDFAGIPKPARRPEPRPPAAMRPRRLSVTEIETLMRSPYDVYAKHVLRLRRKEPLGAEVDARERGTMIHKVFAAFIEAGHDFDELDAAARLMELARDAFKGLDAIGERRDIWLRRFERTAEQFLDFERQRHAIGGRVAELKGEWVFPDLDGFVLSGIADRIDRRNDGTLEIIDFKTGGVPQPKDMTAFDAPQLLLEAAMARAGAFPGIPAADTAALTYIKIGLGPAAFQIKPFKLRAGMSLMAAVDEIGRRTQGHIDAFLLHDGLPMSARIRPRAETGRRRYPGDYDHLARTDEWTLTAGVDDP